MERRSFLRAVPLAAGAGCLGGGSDVVVNVQRDVDVRPHTGWTKRIPDISDGAISYIARADSRFDVYFFDESTIGAYWRFIDGGSPDEQPAGDRRIGMRAVRTDEGVYEARTEDGGRQPIEGGGPHYFVVDHSNYRSRGVTKVGEDAGPVSVFVDLTVTDRQLP